MTIFPDIRQRLYARLRQPPSASSVPQSLPVLFFGDLFTVGVATVGLNPSDQEYFSPGGVELDGEARRLETLTSLGAADRASLTNAQCDRAIQRMRMYYQSGKTIYKWFRALNRVIQGMGYSYEAGEVAHLDLAQEATNPTWSDLAKASPTEFQALRSADLPFLRWQLETFQLHTVICNGRTAFDEVCRLVGGQVRGKGQLKLLTWYVGTATVNGREIKLAGWNRPLAQATGLGASGERELGLILKSHLV